MNPRGVNLPDVWTDIPPVRHAKYKRRKGANELPLKLLDRVIELASDEGDLVLDPFGGSGTTFVASELKSRRWLGVELGPPDDVIRRFQNLDDDRQYLERIRAGYNNLFTPDVAAGRRKKGLWTVESVRQNHVVTPQDQLPFDAED
jgi:site-specific DNA-methyltransferase (adenine-specific)